MKKYLTIDFDIIMSPSIEVYNNYDTKYNTLKVLPEIITYAKQNGYRFEVLSENSYNIHFKVRN